MVLFPEWQEVARVTRAESLKGEITEAEAGSPRAGPSGADSFIPPTPFPGPAGGVKGAREAVGQRNNWKNEGNVRPVLFSVFPKGIITF